MNRFVLAAALALAFVLATAARAGAQETGGSFGGSDFSSSSSSSSSGSDSSGSSGSSGSSDWSSSSGSSSGGYSGGGGASAAPGWLIALVLIGVVVYFVMKKAASSNQLSGLADVSPEPFPEMQGSVLQLGIDWHARAELQATLASLAATGDTASAEGRARLLAETVLALRRAQMSWLYVAYRDLGWAAPAEAQGAFQRASSEARARFRRELVHNQDGQIATQPAPDTSPRQEEGRGAVVVTLIVVTRCALRGVENPRDAASIVAALADRGARRASEVVALEVVWSPAADGDRMSTAELEQHYPELQLIDPTSIAGRIFCAYCSGAFPMELLTCPHCGAPVTSERPAGGPPASDPPGGPAAR